MSLSPAAQARLKLRLREEAEASAATLAKPKARAKIKPALTPAQSVPTIDRPAGPSPAAARKAFLIASTAGHILAAAGVPLEVSGVNDNRELETEAAKVLLMLEEDVRRVKAIKSIEKKIEAKRLLVPNYIDWCDGVLAGEPKSRGALDEVFTTMIAWRIDIGDFIGVMPMVEFAARNELEMPDRFKRGVIEFAVEQIALAAIDAYDGPSRTDFPAALLPQLEDLVEELDADFHDEIMAKLQRALGLAVLAGGDPEDDQEQRDRQKQALSFYTRAIELDPKVGVKKHMGQLQKALKVEVQPDAPPPSAADADAAPNAADADASTAPSPETAPADAEAVVPPVDAAAEDTATNQAPETPPADAGAEQQPAEPES